MPGLPKWTRAVNVIVEATLPTPLFEEQYELKERKALAVTTGGESHAITTDEPKVVALISDGADIQVDTTTISADSPKIKDGASFSFTLAGQATTIYAKAVSGSGTLYIVVFA